MRPLLHRSLAPPRLPPTRRRPAHTTAIAAAVGLLSCCCSWLAAARRAVDTTPAPAAATRAYPGFVRPLTSRPPLAALSSSQQCYSRSLHTLVGASSSSSSSSDNGDSIGAHKSTVFGIHDQYPGTHPAGVTRQLHNERQAGVFDEQARFFAGEEATPPEVVPRLKAIAAAGSPIDPSTRILDVGTGAGVLVPFFKALGAAEANVTGVDVSPGMLAVAKRRYPAAAFWEGDVVDFPPPAWNASFDAVYFNAVFGNLYDQPAAMEALGTLTARGARVVISHPLGAGFVEELKRRSPAVVLSPLPTTDADFETLLCFSRFKLRSLQNDPELYIAVLDWQPHQRLKEAIFLRGAVSKGYGRGSKKLGVPTANLPESLFAEALRDVSTGVYLGWASVGGKRCKAVVNVGYSPTFVGQENKEKIVEAHLIDAEAALGGKDFYDEEMRLVLAGFQRPERRFPSFPELVAAIHQDVADARAALDLPRYQAPGLLALLEDGAATNRRLPFAEWGS